MWSYLCGSTTRERARLRGRAHRPMQARARAAAISKPRSAPISRLERRGQTTAETMTAPLKDPPSILQISPGQLLEVEARLCPAIALADREAFAPQDLPALLVTLDLVS